MISRKHLPIVIVMLVSYIGLLVYPIAYLISPFLSETGHKLVLSFVILTFLPVYALGFWRHKATILQDSIRNTVFKGNLLMKGFATTILFFIISSMSGVILSFFTQLSALPFAVWNPLLEAGILLFSLYTVILKLSILQSYKQTVPSQNEIEEEIEETFNSIETMVDTQNDTDNITKEE